MREHYDLIVVGAGPAGAAAAGFAAARGLGVLLVDKARFPRDKVCGDGVGSGALSALDRLGATPAVEALNPWRIDSLLVSSPDRTEMVGRDPGVAGKRGYGYVIPRKRLDQALFKHVAARAGVDTVLGFSFKDFLRVRGRISGVRGTIDGADTAFSGAYIVGADGAHSAVAKRLGLYNSDRRHRVMAARAYFTGVKGLTSQVEFHYEEAILPGYGWIFPTGPDTANVGVGVASRFKEQKDLTRLFEIFVENNPSAREKLSGASMVKGSFRGWPIATGSFAGPRGKGNVLLAGDAASLVDSVSGEGIYYAVKSGEFAAKAVAGAVRDKTGATSALTAYERMRTRAFNWTEFVPGYFLQSFMNNRTLVNLAVRMAAKDPRKANAIAGALAHSVPKSKLLVQWFKAA
ncbi:MAG: geranylgeranyl reductase family protein [Deltaproteobacteria bacterium]|nr:geranylgeranyl reductase family protein [Deltaproteobacteria bacterium]